jgi:hypothetical protein
MLLCLASTAGAYDTEYYWDSEHVGYTIDNAFTSSYQSSIHAAADAWTEAGADFDYYWSVNSDNKIYYQSLGNPLGTCTRYIYSGTTRLSKWTIKINSDKSWSTSNPCPDDYYDIQSTLTHELGHGVGLGHSSERWATMWPTGYDGTTWKRTLHSDDENGIIAIYGND